MFSANSDLPSPDLTYHVSPQKVARTNRILRLASVALLAAIAWNMLWVLTNLNFGSIFQVVLSLLFAAATVFAGVLGVIHIANTWHFRAVKPKLFTKESRPQVGALIPVWGESISIITNTVRSVLFQRWPADKLVVVVADDAHSDAVKAAVEEMAKTTSVQLHYFRPPVKHSPSRRGEGKAGNLNAAKDYLMANHPHVSYIETRDADDLVADKHFISYCVEYLESHPKTSFVQTIKQCQVSDGDPFCNQESVFYQRTMQAKFAANAVFPCGSGLMWRRQELEKIGGFPAWNLVEDLQSGYEILRRGGRGAYLPIVGAMGQIAPEDIPNFYKQRGTWALDSLRLLYYRNPLFTKGLTLMQKLQFLEMQLGYLFGFAMAVFVGEILLSLFLGVTPVVSPGPDYLLHLLVIAVAIETHMVARARGIGYKEQQLARQTWIGLTPVFIKAAFLALWYGPHRKPRYKVTKKYHTVGWYWRETLIQSVTFAALMAAVIYSMLTSHGDPLRVVSLQYWALFLAYSFSRVITNSWHNYKLPLPRLFARRARTAS